MIIVLAVILMVVLFCKGLIFGKKEVSLITDRAILRFDLELKRSAEMFDIPEKEIASEKKTLLFLLGSKPTEDSKEDAEEELKSFIRLWKSRHDKAERKRREENRDDRD